jgi:hypothetical protein
VAARNEAAVLYFVIPRAGKETPSLAAPRPLRRGYFVLYMDPNESHTQGGGEA